MLIRLAYDIQFDIPATVAMVALLNVHPSRSRDLLEPDEMQTEPRLEITHYIDSFGNRCARFVAPPGHLRLFNSTLIQDSGLLDQINWLAHESAVVGRLDQPGSFGCRQAREVVDVLRAPPQNRTRSSPGGCSTRPGTVRRSACRQGRSEVPSDGSLKAHGLVCFPHPTPQVRPGDRSYSSETRTGRLRRGVEQEARRHGRPFDHVDESSSPAGVSGGRGRGAEEGQVDVRGPAVRPSLSRVRRVPGQREAELAARHELGAAVRAR